MTKKLINADTVGTVDTRAVCQPLGSDGLW